MMGGTGASQIITALSAPALSRIFSPQEFGVYAIALSIYGILAALGCLRYEMAVVLPRTMRSAVNIVALCLVTTMITTTIALVITVGSWVLSNGQNAADLHGWSILLIPTGVMLFGLQQVTRFWLVRHKLFSTISNMVMTQAIVTVAFQIGAGLLLSSSPIYLMVGMDFGLLAMVLIAVPDLKRTLSGRILTAIRVSRIALLAFKHRRFPLFAAPFGFVSQATLRVILLIIAYFVSTEMVGEFALAQRVVYVPVSVLAGSMSLVFFSRAAQQLNNPELHNFVLRALVAGAFICVPLLALNATFSEALFSLIFGAKWALAGRFAAWLGIAAGIVTLTSWLDRVYDICSRQKLLLIMEVFADATCLGLLAIVMYFTHDAVSGIAWYSMGLCCYYVVWTYTAFRIAAFPMRYYNKALGVTLGLAVVCFGTASFLRAISLPNAVQLAVSLAIAVPLIGKGVLLAKGDILRTTATRPPA